MKKITAICFVTTVLLSSLFYGISVHAQALCQTEFEVKDTLGIYSRIGKCGQETTDNQSSASANADSNTETANTDENAQTNEEVKKPTKQTVTCILTKGMKETYYLNMDGKVKWSVSNKKVARLTKKNNKKCTIKALKNGTTTITAKTATQTLKIKVTVKSGNSFVNAWCKDWVRKYISKDMSKYDKVLIASYYMNICYDYGQTSSVKDVIVKKKGTCVSGGKLLVKLLNKMGFEAKLRFAANDNMVRYPQGIYFASQHHNVQVKINKKNYYVDGTPATGFIYLSSSKKPLYCAFILGGGLVPVLDEIHK